MMNLTDNPHLHKTDVSRSTLFWADCFDVFPSIPDKSIDAIIADLPYGQSAECNMRGWYKEIEREKAGTSC